MNEEWRPVVGYEGLYEVSNTGRIKSFHQGDAHKILAAPPNNKGYNAFVACKDGDRKTLSVHRVVLLAFVGECPVGLQSAHLDGNKKNNTVYNLEWVTPKINIGHKKDHGTGVQGDRNPSRIYPETRPRGEKHFKAKLNAADILEIRTLRKKEIPVRVIAKMYNMSKGAIDHILSGRNWKHLLEPPINLQPP